MVYELFMLSVQLVFLNLLIAILTDTHTSVRGVAQLVARLERAKLVLEEEEKIASWQVISHPSSAIRHQSSAIGHQSLATSHQPRVIRRRRSPRGRSSVISHQSLVLSHLSSAISRQPSAISHLSLSLVMRRSIAAWQAETEEEAASKREERRQKRARRATGGVAVKRRSSHSERVRHSPITLGELKSLRKSRLRRATPPSPRQESSIKMVAMARIHGLSLKIERVTISVMAKPKRRLAMIKSRTFVKINTGSHGPSMPSTCARVWPWWCRLKRKSLLSRTRAPASGSPACWMLAIA